MWQDKLASLSEGAKAELAADIQFALAVNDMAVSTQGQILAKSNAEPFRQFIVEMYSFNTGAFPTPESWFLDEGRQKFADQIREMRKLYEASEEEKVEQQAGTNKVLEQLERLSADIAAIQASKGDTPAEAEEEEADEEAEADEEEANDEDEADEEA